MPSIDADLVRSLTAGGLLLLLVLLLIMAFMLGLIRPRSAIREVREDRDARLADKDQQISEWREAHRGSEEAREVHRVLGEITDTLRSCMQLTGSGKEKDAGERGSSDQSELSGFAPLLAPALDERQHRLARWRQAVQAPAGASLAEALRRHPPPHPPRAPRRNSSSTGSQTPSMPAAAASSQRLGTFR